MLSDRDIRLALSRREIWIKPVPESQQIQPASVDLNLGTSFLHPNDGFRVDDNKVIPNTANIGDRYLVAAGDFILATTLETITIGPGHVGRVEGKSSFGRKGLTVHVTAGFIDPGFSGQVTLELANISKIGIWLTVGEPICQMSFERLDTPCGRPYGSEGLGSHYQYQQGVQKSALGG